MSFSPDEQGACWREKYKIVPHVLKDLKNIGTLAAAFNVNVDSVVKISGRELADYIKKLEITLAELEDDSKRAIDNPKDIFRGVFRCFTAGIAEEWIAADAELRRWMEDNLGLKKLQMGAQAGIIANTLSLTDIQKIVVHTACLPKTQADCFYPRNNLLSFDENGKLRPAFAIDRPNEKAPVHWIIEFSKDDRLDIGGKTYVCPKSNRFIATYDPALFNLQINPNFADYTEREPVDIVILSGYQALSEKNNGLYHLEKTLPLIEKWRQKKPRPLLHLEIASTQDLAVREQIARKIMPLVDSCGANEREAADILEVLGFGKAAESCRRQPNAENLLLAADIIARQTSCPRIQLHTYGFYLTLQNTNFPLPPANNLNGMLLAAVAAASKAREGRLAAPVDITAAAGLPPSTVGLQAVNGLAALINDGSFASTGIGSYKDRNIIAVPAIIIDRPQTLVGMGDTISAFSLVGAAAIRP